MSRMKPIKGIESLAAAVIVDMEKENRQFCEGCKGNPDRIWKFLTDYKPHDSNVCPFDKGSECCNKFKWACDRAYFTAKATGLDWKDVLAAWEKNRLSERFPSWYMNYYQQCNQPAIGGENVFVFNDLDEFKAAVGSKGFICPNCGNVSDNPYECDSGECDWKSYGLFGTMGKGAYVFLKDAMRGQGIFMPVALAGE